MKHINVMLFCLVCGLAVTEVAGSSLDIILHPISYLYSLLVEKLSSYCLSPFEATGCNNNSESNDTGSFPRQTKAFLFTEKNPSEPEFLHGCGGHLAANTNFNPEHKTEIFIHGWLDGVCRTEWPTSLEVRALHSFQLGGLWPIKIGNLWYREKEMKNELLKRGSYNVILIDWTWGNGLKYDTGANNTYVVAGHVASLIQNIMMDTGVGPDNFHVVGHSFGAQIAGLAGKLVPNLRRITALDPALVPFEDKPSSERLDASDANLVDVIHSNGGMEAFKTLGDIQPLGDADFYPNGGMKQLSCVPFIIKSFAKLDLLYAAFSLLPIFCNHLQSIQYYKASINPKCEFVGVQCLDYASFESGDCSSCGEGHSRCAIMGMDYEYSEHPSKEHSGKYYLDTELFYPYCKNSTERN